MTVISVRSVTKSMQDELLYRDVDLEFEAGRMYGLTGPNGSGKSVLLRMLCGFIRPDRGGIDIDPGLMGRGRTFPDRFGIIIDGPAYLPGLSAEKNLMELARIRGRIGRTEVREILDQLGLGHAGSKRARTFSAGMKQKLGLAQALMEDPAVLILDEPFTALDEQSAAAVRGILARRREQGCTIIAATHGEAAYLAACDEVFRIHDQRITPRQTPPGNPPAP